MTTENSPPESPSMSRRRSSLVPSQKITELFGRSPGAAPTAYPGPIATAAANAQAHQRRRMSISTFGLAGTSPTQAGLFGATRLNQDNSSGGGMSPDMSESAVEDGDSSVGSTPSTPFARRISFGARAMGSVRGSLSGSNGRVSFTSSGGGGVPDNGTSNPNAVRSMRASLASSGRGEGFNWSDQIRNRAQRSSSAAAAGSPSSATAMPPSVVPVVQAPAPVVETPKPPARASRVPDHFQERILKGDFYMD